MEKINVSKERCIGCGACVAIDPEHFEFDDNGKSECISNENLDSGNLINAIESCPTSAIEKVEDEGNLENTTCESCCNSDSCCNEECDCDCDCDECDSCDCEECEEHNNLETEDEEN